MKKPSIIYALLIVLITSCSSSNKEESEYPIINVEQALKDFRIKNLSDYASSIRYVLLETTDECLVTNYINNIFLEDNKIFVYDNEPFLKVFDATTGKYLYNVGKKGLGPGESTGITAVDINIEDKRIILSSMPVHEYNFEGKFIGKVELPYIGKNETSNRPIVSMSKDNYASAVRPDMFEHQENSIIVFNNRQEVLETLECYDHPIQPDIYGPVWSPEMEGGQFYRSNGNLRYFRGFTDTIYANQRDKNTFSPLFIINYGKHKSTLDYNRGAENPNIIQIASISENKKLAFLKYRTRNASPEPFKKSIPDWRTGSGFIEITDNSIVGLLDKKKQEFHFLLQPIPGMVGLANDLDNGIPFKVLNTSSSGELIDYYQASDFLENAARLSNPDPNFIKIANQVKETDNPILIIAQ